MLRNRATLAAVGSELRANISTRRVLSSAESLAANDFEAFHEEARKVLVTQPHWRNVVLVAPDGRSLVNARLPRGWELVQKKVETRSLNQGINEMRPAVGDLTLAPLLNHEPGVPVRLPIIRHGKVVGVLTAVLAPSLFQDLLQAHVCRSIG